MNIFARIGAALSAMGEAWAASERTVTLGNAEGWLDYGGGSAVAASGISISETTALNVTTVYACTAALSGIQSSLPCHVVQEVDGGTERRRDDYRYPLLHDAPNDEMDSGQWRQMCCVGSLLWGNGVSFIQLSPRGRVLGIWGLTSDRVSFSRDRATRRLVYTVTNETGSDTTLQPWQVLHFRELGYDGIVGKSRIGLHREAIGLASVTERHGAEFFGQGGRPGPVVTSSRRLTWAQTQNIEKLIASRRGPGNFSRPLVLGEGLAVSEYSMPHDDAQFLETRRFQVEEIAGRVFLMPLWMVGGEMNTSMGSTLEQQMIAFTTVNVAPRALHWERELTQKLFTAAEIAAGYRVKLDLRGLLRADHAQRISGYASAIQNGWMTRNEARALEDFNPGPAGLDEFMVQTGGAGLAIPARAPQQTGGPNERQRAAVANLYTTTWSRVLRRGRQDWARVEAGRLDGAAWDQEMDAYATEQLEPVHRTWEAVGGRVDRRLWPLDSAHGTGDIEAAARDAAEWSMSGREETEA